VLKYEQIRDLIMNDAFDAGLDVYNIRNYIEMETLDRTSKISCVPIGFKPGSGITAEISFDWDCMYSSESIYGSSCDLYHDEAVNCPHMEYEPDAFIELEIKFNFPVSKAEDIPEIYRRIKKVLQNEISHNNYPQIKFEISVLADGRVVVHDSYAYMFWEVPFNDYDIDFSRIFNEIKNILIALYESNVFKTKKWK